MKLQELLVLPLVERDRLLDEEDHFNVHRDEDDGEEEDEMITSLVNKRLQVVSLQSVPSTRACERIVTKFIKSKTRRIVSSFF